MSRRTDSSALRYAFREVDLQEKEDARTQQVLMVGTRKKVLEIGPASGYVTKALRNRGCSVTCVEVDPRAARAAREYANRMINADIEIMNFEKELGEERYDVILFGDVLEHLKDPKAVLSGLRPYLKPSGYVVATAPNVAHGSVRLLLLDGKFDPQATGILDWTHLHFYTRRTLLELFRDAGYTVELVKEIKAPVSAAENLRINLKEYPAELIRAIESDPNSTTFEFALVAKPATGSVSQRIPGQRQLVSRQLGLRRYDPLSTLLYLYLTRSDLRAAFPEVEEGNYRRLLEWANNTIENRADNAHRMLRPCAYWYRNNPISSEPEFRREHEVLEEELRNQKEHATNLEEERKALADQTQALVTELTSTREALRNERDVLRNESARALSEKDELSSNLRYARAELDSIKSSFGYKFMRFYASRIDCAFPDNTRRGEFKNIVKQSLRIASSQGVMALFRQVMEKLRRRESKIVTLMPQITREPIKQILLQCDYPRLPAEEPIRVPNWFSVEGWAVSKSGIGQVRVYLDDVDLGNASYGIRRPDVAKAFPDYPASESSGFRKPICVENLTQGLRTLRIVAQSHDNSSATMQAVLEFPQSGTSEITTAKPSENRPESLSARVSVVIPTKSLPDDFEQTLQQIKDQRITDIEILVMNSGSTDLAFLERRYGAKVHPVDPTYFDHGRTRNYGAELATGDYVYFMTDDAIPANNLLFSDMLRIMEKNRDVAAVTARQIPRSDADLTACEAIWSYYRALQLSEDRVVGSHDLDSLTPDEKRRICQIDNVCSCFKRRLFLEYRFKSGLAYAEDLELGIRLVKDGHKIGQLFSNGVIHSHNRPPSYYLRRAYVEAKTLPELLGSDSRELATDGVQSLDGVLDLILDLHDLVCYAVDEIKRTDLSDKTIPEVFQRIRKNLTLGKRISANAAGASEDLSGCLTRVVSIAHHSRSRRQDFNPLIEAYATSLENLEKWLLGSHHTLLGMAEQLAESLHKLMAVQAGAFLGRYYVKSRLLENRVEERLAQLDKFLSMGV